MSKRRFLLPLFTLGLASLLAGCRPPPAPPASGLPAPASFSGQRALKEATDFIALGPRESGTPGAERAALYLAGRLREAGLAAEVDVFTNAAPGGPLVFRNVIGRLPGSRPGTVILMSHYDTKSGIAPDFAGANDSGSSTGVLLELARLLAGRTGGPALEFLFTDGEECRVSYGPADGLHGSRRRARQLAESGEAARVEAVLLLDMIGDRDLRVTLPRNGDPALMLAILRAAEAEGARGRFSLLDGAMLDDHVPFLEAGMPAVDLIDFAYGEGYRDNRYWHTAEDTADKLSAESLEITGRVVLRWLGEKP
jgi:glutaminyl-peptide cyclotransferase